VTKADKRLEAAYSALGLANAASAQKYKQLDKIVEHLEEGVIRSSKARASNARIMGSISERLCRLGLDAAYGITDETERPYVRLSDDWEWLGDFSLPGNPFNVLVSVKSFKAKERLIVSGVRSLIVPTVGWGLFNDPGEWLEERVRSYIFSGFAAIYLPRGLLTDLSLGARSVVNANGNVLLRRANEFVRDVRGWLDVEQRVDLRKI